MKEKKERGSYKYNKRYPLTSIVKVSALGKKEKKRTTRRVICKILSIGLIPLQLLLNLTLNVK
ncbi:hypothetical protein V1477_008013 [Vespula maculifrons]|uniref:Uncharacterized protein n=1 Tax=Vespula maculifrons TaxID=7453 RepID=A0ABD2CG10_VESMC